MGSRSDAGQTPAPDHMGFCSPFCPFRLVLLAGGDRLSPIGVGLVIEFLAGYGNRGDAPRQSLQIEMPVGLRNRMPRMSLDRVGEAEIGRQHVCNILISSARLDTVFSIRSLNYQ